MCSFQTSVTFKCGQQKQKYIISVPPSSFMSTMLRLWDDIKVTDFKKEEGNICLKMY